MLPRPLRHRALALLLGLPLLAQAQAPTITALSPARNAVAAPRATPVALTFSQPMAGATAGRVRVFSQQRGGRLAGTPRLTASKRSNTFTFTPRTPFQPGETVFVTIPPAARATKGARPARGHVYQFTAAVGGSGAGTFGGTQNVAVGPAPQSVAVGDVDGDGDLDLVTGHFNAEAPSVSVRLNDGGGLFGGGPDLSTGTFPRTHSVVLGDVNADGDLDLLVANYADGTVSVRLNDGRGTFTGGQEVRVGMDPRGVLVGDVDADGDLDLLAVNEGDGEGDGTVSVRVNDGAGGFGGGSEVALGGVPYQVAVGDVDGDGDLDMLVALWSGVVRVERNDGTGTFRRTQTLGATSLLQASREQSIALGDLDGDGDLDLAWVNTLSEAAPVRVCFNNGRGTFAGRRKVAVEGVTQRVTLGDMDGDGDLDLIIGFDTGQHVGIVRNTGAGRFGPPQLVAVRPYATAEAVGDVDGDGDLDLLVANGGYALDTDTVSIRLNGGTGPRRP